MSLRLSKREVTELTGSPQKRKLKHAVVVTTEGDNLRLFALPLGSKS